MNELISTICETHVNAHKFLFSKIQMCKKKKKKKQSLPRGQCLTLRIINYTKYYLEIETSRKKKNPTIHC